MNEKNDQKGDFGGKGGAKAKIDLTTVATALGYTTVAELKTALVSGTSIADLATAKGITVQSVIDLEVVQIIKDLDAKLAAGTITQAQYDKQKAASTAIATSNVNDKNDHKGDFGGFGGGGWKRRGVRGADGLRGGHTARGCCPKPYAGNH